MRVSPRPSYRRRLPAAGTGSGVEQDIEFAKHAVVLTIGDVEAHLWRWLHLGLEQGAGRQQYAALDRGLGNGRRVGMPGNVEPGEQPVRPVVDRTETERLQTVDRGDAGLLDPRDEPAGETSGSSPGR